MPNTDMSKRLYVIVCVSDISDNNPLSIFITSSTCIDVLHFVGLRENSYLCTEKSLVLYDCFFSGV